jgi:putative DNA primase/helicase
MTHCDPQEIRRTASLMKRPGEVYELRAIDVVTPTYRRKHVESGYFDDDEKLVAAAVSYPNAMGIYITLNPVSNALLSRCANRMQVAEKNATTPDKYVKQRRRLLIDADAERPAGISSSDAEHKAAIDKVKFIAMDLGMEHNWPAPILADSGNGGHLIYSIDLPGDDSGLIEKLLAALAAKYSDPEDTDEEHGDPAKPRIKIDCTVFNPARITKLYGTRCCKGDDTPDRPHRISRILEVPKEIELLSAEMMQSFVDAHPPEEQGKPAASPGSNGKVNGKHYSNKQKWLEDWIKAHSVPVGAAENYANGIKYVFTDHCPFNSDHKASDAAITIRGDRYGFKCFHDGCKGNGWKELRELYDPKSARSDYRTAFQRSGGATNGENSDEELDRATELANAEEMHRRHGHELRYHVDRGEFSVSTGKQWKSDVEGQVTRWAKAIARTSTQRLLDSVDRRELARFQKQVESARGIESVLRLLRTEPGISVTHEAFDQDDYLLNVANGTIDLRTGKLRPHDPADMITHCICTPYNPAAMCPLWQSVVTRSMDGNEDLIAYLQRWCGLFLTGAPNVHELLICYGSGANGKSLIFDFLCWLLESLAGVAPESLLIARHGQSEHPTEIADLLGKRLVVASETESGATLRLQLIKRLTGDATIKARFMRQDFFEFRRTHKLVLITNNKPRLSENTEAVWRRLRLLPFNVVIPPAERDPHLLEKLKTEAAGILAWCVRGCLEQQRTGMNPPQAVLVATDEYRSEADDLADFLQAKCMIGDPGVFRVSRADLYSAYIAWAKASNERHPLERNAFYEAIRRREGINDVMFKAGGNPVRGFKGIGLASGHEEGSR